MFLNIFVFFISVIPLITWHKLYEGPKVIFYLFLTIVVILYWVYKVLKNKENFEFTKIDYAYFLFLIILTISSLLGEHVSDSIIGSSYRHQGVIFFVGLWVIGKTVSVLSTNQKKLLSKVLAMVIFAESLLVIIQYFTGNLYFDRPLGTIGEANAVFGFLSLGVYFVWNSFNFIYLIPIVLIILFSGSRSALLTLLVYSGIFLKNLKTSRKVMVLIVVILVALFGSLYIAKDRGISFVEDRVGIWKRAIIQIYNQPILGYGAESGEYVFNNSFLKQGVILENIIVDRAHNLFLDVAMWSGVVGLIFFIVWLVFSFINLESVEKKFAFLSFLIYSMFQPLSIVHWILLIIIINI